ncbi:hypothetical protein GCM10010840_15510 [Deinococcus aerolatus]|uniref:Uncharacterized protein n=1 Tax=Deinococcus aerolatus TaxID=522487 RepID=A0ABQ2G7B9_9DEIO|nr:hypothetical protein GCM10010840_15510 [Deinococcus aerolatus]
MRTPTRTWERGETPLNLLVLGVVLHGYTVPLVWTALDHDGGEWFRFLRRKKIKRAIRIRKNAVVDELRVDAWFGDLKVGEVRCLAERANVYGEVMQVVATRCQRVGHVCAVPSSLVRGVHLREPQGARL